MDGGQEWTAAHTETRQHGKHESDVGCTRQGVSASTSGGNTWPLAKAPA